MAFNVYTVTVLNIKSFTNSCSRRFYWYIPGVPIKADFIEQNITIYMPSAQGPRHNDIISENSQNITEHGARKQ